MSFIVPGKKGNFLNAKIVKESKLEGKTATITGEGEITEFKSPEGKTKTVWNIPVRIEGKEFTFTPNATNLDIMTEAWGTEKGGQKGVEQEDVVGKSFEISLVKVNFRGQSVDSVQIKPLKLGAPVQKIQL